MLGRYSSGKYLDDVYGADMYDRAVEGYIFCIEHQRPAGAIGRMAHANRDFIPFRALDLPLASNGEDVDVILKVTDFM
jgi:hypothetical protein